MHRLPWRLPGLLALVLVLVGPLPARTNEDGAPLGNSGAPGEATCAVTGCHTGNALNDGMGAIRLDGPTAYQPGIPTDMTVTVERIGASRFGFSITLRDDQNRFVGAFEQSDANTQFADALATTLTHDEAVSADNVASWTLRWHPPDTLVGPVTFYAAGNAANGNGRDTGDFIYTTHRTLARQTATESTPGLSPLLTVAPPWPHPCRNRCTLAYQLHQAATVTFTLYDGRGRVVRQQVRGHQPGGRYEHPIPTAGLPAGTYFFALQADAHRQTGLLQVLRD
jgi:hypothetical protein